jgi:hypothetical protein
MRFTPATDARRARSYLFVPGDRPDRFRKGFNTGADAVILDLKDAVSADNQSAARDAVDKLGDARQSRYCQDQRARYEVGCIGSRLGCQVVHPPAANPAGQPGGHSRRGCMQLGEARA